MYQDATWWNDTLSKILHEVSVSQNIFASQVLSVDSAPQIAEWTENTGLAKIVTKELANYDEYVHELIK